jgi:hypothetical protein
MGVVSITLIVLVTGLILWAFYLSWDVRRWDAKIDALCAANGGRDVATRVYETVMAPETKEYFAELPGGRSFFIPSRSVGVTLGPQYPFVIETRVLEVLNKRSPSVVKYTERIVRVSDEKILAERFGYQRGGGGVQLFDPGEIRNCPAIRTEDRLDVQVFANHPRHQIAR